MESFARRSVAQTATRAALIRRVVLGIKPIKLFPRSRVKPRLSQCNILKELFVFLKSVHLFRLKLRSNKEEGRFRMSGSSCAIYYYYCHSKKVFQLLQTCSHQWKFSKNSTMVFWAINKIINAILPVTKSMKNRRITTVYVQIFAKHNFRGFGGF